jgi:hypothetical protein
VAPQLRKAERKQAKMRVGVTAPSGGGKTYSALLLARGLSTAWDKVALIDTENGSGELYAHLGPYNVITLDPPFTPERYIEAIQACEAAGMETIIVDSATHEWDGSGGCLEIYNKLGGKYQDWAKITPRHQKFLDAILGSDCHIVTTTRRKQDYEMEKSSDGRVRVEKVGMKEVQRDGFEYELTLNFELDIRHNAIASKDRTGCFMDRPALVITEETGRTLKTWCEMGATVAPKAEPVNGTATATTVSTNGPVIIATVTDKPYRQGGKALMGYVLTFSDGREARTSDAALAGQAKQYRDCKTGVVPVIELKDGKGWLIELGALEQAL